MQGRFLIAAQLATSQEGLSSMKLVNNTELGCGQTAHTYICNAVWISVWKKLDKRINVKLDPADVPDSAASGPRSAASFALMLWLLSRWRGREMMSVEYNRFCLSCLNVWPSEGAVNARAAEKFSYYRSASTFHIKLQMWEWNSLV
jgi:hypothetical protein